MMVWELKITSTISTSDYWFAYSMSIFPTLSASYFGENIYNINTLDELRLSTRIVIYPACPKDEGNSPFGKIPKMATCERMELPTFSLFVLIIFLFARNKSWRYFTCFVKLISMATRIDVRRWRKPRTGTKRNNNLGNERSAFDKLF